VNIFLIFIAALAALVILWLLISRRQGKKKPVAYVCDQCGESHCDCYREEEIKASDKN
jgi:hypothetical protein